MAWLERKGQFQNLQRHNLVNNYNTYLANISRSKGKQAMKFAQLPKYNQEKTFL